MGGYPTHHRARQHILTHLRARGDHRLLADRNVWQEDRTGANPRISADRHIAANIANLVAEPRVVGVGVQHDQHPWGDGRPITNRERAGNPLQNVHLFPDVVAIEIVAVLVLWLLRLRLESLFLVVSLLADLLGGVLKIVVGRHRPSPDLVHVVQQIQQPSFPSGHTLHYTVFYGFLFFVIATNFKSSWLRNTALVSCALLVLLVGPSRVYLGEHWPTDVLGGYLVGALCLAPLIAGYLWAKAHLTVTASPPWIHRIPPVSAEPPAGNER